MHTCSVHKKLEIVPGKLSDYRQLAAYHYRDGRLAAVKRVFLLKPNRPLGTASGRAVGVIVYAMPNPRVELRNPATGEIFSGLVAEHAELIKSIRQERPRINDCERMAESTMTMILGRMAAYSGRQLKWDYALNADEDLFPKQALEMGPMPVAPLPVPGKMELL